MLFLDYYDYFLEGLWKTSTSAVFAFIGGLILGIILAVMRGVKFAPVRWVATVYVEIMRNTPVLVQIFFIFFGFPSIGIRMPAMLAGTLALALNAGAYICEIVRTGIRSIPSGQLEAAKTLGLSQSKTISKIVLPQALRVVYPPIMNEFHQIILGTSMLSTIAVNELTGVSMLLNALTFRTIEVFIIAFILYLVITNTVTFLSRFFEHRFLLTPSVRVQDMRRNESRGMRTWRG